MHQQTFSDTLYACIFEYTHAFLFVHRLRRAKIHLQHLFVYIHVWPKSTFQHLFVDTCVFHTGVDWSVPACGSRFDELSASKSIYRDRDREGDRDRDRDRGL